MKRTIELLNKALADELTAIHQYLYFHFHFNDQGNCVLVDFFKKIAIEEMKHMERLAERILFLKGDIHLTSSQKIQPVHQLKEMLTIAKKMETDSAANYNKWAKECSTDCDPVSRQLFEELEIDEERHSDQFEAEIKCLEDLENNYLAVC